MRTFYARPDPNAYLVPALFLLVGLSQTVPPFFGNSPSAGGLPQSPVWNTATLCRFCLGLASIAAVYCVWPRPYRVTVSDRGIQRDYGAGFWGDHTARRFSMAWEELVEWSFRSESDRNGEEWFTHDYVHIRNDHGRQFCLGGYATELRDELRRWVPDKERPAESGDPAAPNS